MAKRKDYSGKYQIGRRVSFGFMTAAVSCQSSHLLLDVGIITGTELANGVRCYVIDGATLVSEDEIKGYAR